MGKSASSHRQPEQGSDGPRRARTPPEDTTSLIHRAQTGDETALEELCARYHPRLFRWATGRLPSKARSLIDTSDVVQDTLVKTIRGIGDFKVHSPGAFPAYLRTAILNRIKDELRRAVVKPEIGSLDGREEDDSPSPLEQIIGKDQIDQYEHALGLLEKDDQAAIFLRIELEMSYPDLAEALDKPSPDAARMAVNRALVRLARTMHDEYGKG